jgi:aspartate/methionine/tyrosine aminotransferase
VFLSHSIDRESDLERLGSKDDPYFYLYYGDTPRYPSYFSLERQELEVGRVLRFDSLSKILSAGIRIGFASGPEALLAAMDSHVCLTRYPCIPVVFFSSLTAKMFEIDSDSEPASFISHTSYHIYAA